MFIRVIIDKTVMRIFFLIGYWLCFYFVLGQELEQLGWNNPENLIPNEVESNLLSLGYKKPTIYHDDNLGDGEWRFFKFVKLDNQKYLVSVSEVPHSKGYNFLVIYSTLKNKVLFESVALFDWAIRGVYEFKIIDRSVLIIDLLEQEDERFLTIDLSSIEN